MTLEGLKIFCDVVREKSFSRGALANRVSQSAASQAISQIERRLGVQLIDRSKRPLALTREGRLYYDGCRELVDRYFALEARARSLHEEAGNRITVASIYSISLYDMSRHVQRFMARYPKGNVRLEYVHPAKVYDKVLNEQADLGIVSFPRSLRGLAIVPWREEPMVLVCCPTHPFAEGRHVTSPQLNGVDFVGFDEDLAIRRYIDRSLRQHGVAVNVVMTFDNVEAIKRGVEAGLGVSILPGPTVANETASGSLVAVRWNGPALMRPLCIVHRRRRHVTPGMASFIELLKQAPQNGTLATATSAAARIAVNGSPRIPKESKNAKAANRR